MISYGTRLDQIFLALHILGVMMWMGGLFAVMAFLEATLAEKVADARARLVVHLRQAAIVPDVGLTLGLVFGAHWLFKHQLYKAPFMHIKLTIVAALIVLHVLLRLKVKKIKNGAEVAPPHPALKPVTTLLMLGALVLVVTKLPS